MPTASTGLNLLPNNSIDAVVTDPPYGVKEYEVKEIERMHNGGSGVWRLPPAYDGNVRAPLPRFTALEPKERETLQRFFREWAGFLLPKLKPGAHVFVACNSFMSQLVFSSLIEGGLEFRTEVIRMVQTLRGGDRPKLGEQDFPDVCSLPRGGYEPWGLFRKPMPKKMTVRECLREFGTGGLRRRTDGKPFFDVIPSEPDTPARARHCRPPEPQASVADAPACLGFPPLGRGALWLTPSWAPAPPSRRRRPWATVRWALSGMRTTSTLPHGLCRSSGRLPPTGGQQRCPRARLRRS